MEWPKLSERFFVFVAALVPGSVVLILFRLHAPEPLNAIWQAQNLGNETKVCIVLAGTFVAGWTAMSAVYALSGMIGALVATVSGSGKPTPPPVKPWCNKNWRALLAKYLGEAAPENIEPIYDEVFSQQLEFIKQYYAEPECSKQTAAISAKKFAADQNSAEWEGWWIYLHNLTFNEREPMKVIANTLGANFQCASLVVVSALAWTPQFLRWWIIAPSVFWLFMLTAEVYTAVKKYLNHWSTFNSQLEYLETRVSKGERFKTATAS